MSDDILGTRYNVSHHTRLAVYIHSLISKIVRRRPDLESKAVESVLLENADAQVQYFSWLYL